MNWRGERRVCVNRGKAERGAALPRAVSTVTYE